MKLRFLPSLLIFISSYAPLALIIVIKDLNDMTMIPNHLVASIAILSIALLSCVVVRIAAQKITGGVAVKITKAANKSGDLFAYTIPYMISFYNFNLGDWKTLLCMSIFLILMFSLSYKTQNVFVNPILALAGYGLYDCQFKDGPREMQGLLLSKLEFQIGDTCRVERLSNFLYFVSFVQPKEDLNVS
jgi:hypothetical protein